MSRSILTVAAAVLVVFAGVTRALPRLEKARPIPAPAVDEPASQAGSEIVVLAGGCFWGVQGVYQHVKGVSSAISGYTGGEKGTAEYERVSTGMTGHAESVRIAFDPSQHLLRTHPADLFFCGPRSHRAQSTGTGRRYAVPVRDLPDD
jgi:peptide-methionine (S)-S-oxide reductase